MIRVAILTVSDSCAAGKREDVSGHVIEEMLSRDKFQLQEKRVVPSSHDAIVKELNIFSDKSDIDVVFTVGGTGLGARDITPEATKAVCRKMFPGLPEMMRAESLKNKTDIMLSRAVAGIRNNTLIVNLPGRPQSVKDCLEIILDVLVRAVERMNNNDHG